MVPKANILPLPSRDALNLRLKSRTPAHYKPKDLVSVAIERGVVRARLHVADASALQPAQRLAPR
jgi:hypothetical protein